MRKLVKRVRRVMAGLNAWWHGEVLCRVECWCDARVEARNRLLYLEWEPKQVICEFETFGDYNEGTLGLIGDGHQDLDSFNARAEADHEAWLPAEHCWARVEPAEWETYLDDGYGPNWDECVIVVCRADDKFARPVTIAEFDYGDVM